jgi:hypothetical protein
MLGIVRRQSIQAQPPCLAAYRPARAVQPFDNLRHRVCWPQGDKFAEFLVGPAGHLGLGHGGPQRLVPCQPIRVATLAIASFPQRRTRMRAACRAAVVVVGAVRCCRRRSWRRDAREGLAMSALRPEADIWAGLQHVCFVPILLQKSEVASVRIFGETLKHEATDDSYNLSRATEVAYEFSVRR